VLGQLHCLFSTARMAKFNFEDKRTRRENEEKP
jgi:hypothetical protein